MITEFLIRRNEYHDSVFLMRVARRISDQKGIRQAAALMGTQKNKSLLAAIGFDGAEGIAASPNDLILAIRAEDGQSLAAVLEKVKTWLHPESDSPVTSPARTLDEAISRVPGANLAVISVPGAHAAREARIALDRGLNVFLFSDNVSIESERELKELARERGLIVMGPDCGTALISGKGIGFANVVRRGPIGVVGASGTGIQEFTTLVHHAGSGISHAMGIGGRDLSDAIGGISLFSALDALESDPDTRVIAVISKPPGPKTLARILSRTRECRKPVVTCFLGLRDGTSQEGFAYRSARTLDEAATEAVRIATGCFPSSAEKPVDLEKFIAREMEGKTREQKYIRGLFAGGTFCYQAQQILRDTGLSVCSNSPIEGNRPLSDPFRSMEHTLVDLGADEFTVGRPHPMIDSRLRCERILAEAQDPQTAVLLIDLILGYNASQDPAGELLPSLLAAKKAVEKRGGSLTLIASVCGTEVDSQRLSRQVERLEQAGAAVFLSASQAAFHASRLAVRLEGISHV
jgi:succinyl-CoA synthetase alpha subunit